MPGNVMTLPHLNFDENDRLEIAVRMAVALVPLHPQVGSWRAIAQGAFVVADAIIDEALRRHGQEKP